MDSLKFLFAINLVLSAEGELSVDPEDDGNWTGGAQGKGELVGTKYGISAAQYPSIDIRGLNRAQAVQIYWRDYWIPNRCEDMPIRTAAAYFDACVNQGPNLAAVALQRALGVKADGVVGPITLAAARSSEDTELVWRVLAERAWQYTGTKNFKRFGRGWINRLFEICKAIGDLR